MKTLQQFITEVRSTGDSIQKGEKLSLSVVGKSVRREGGEVLHPESGFKSPHKVEKLASGHEIHHYEKEYHVTSPDGKKVHMALDVKHINKKAKSEKIHDLVAHKDNTFKAHHLYHHLITKHKKILSTDTQSPGGHAVWKKLIHMKGVGVHGWDPKTKKPVNISRHLGDDHETHAVSSTHYWTKGKGTSRTEGHAETERMHLVAHKK